MSMDWKQLLKRLIPVSALIVSLVCATRAVYSKEQEHPNLVLTASAVKQMAAQYRQFPLFNLNVEATKLAVDALRQESIVVPVPKDSGGGYTHEQHKRNYKTIHDAGLLYQLTGELVYADFARDMLLEYAALFPTLDRHPVIKSSSPGRLFWQSLNEAVWLLYSIQGYDAILPSLSQSQRDTIESNLFVPLATFLSDGQPNTFDRIHNHGTWAAAAVGMTGYVLGRDDFVQKALYGLDQSGNSGFLKQLDELFSPDGYYNEGPYYQRYALMPFILFAQAIQNNEPERQIFSHRDGVLLKAIYGAIQLSYNQRFFPINDAIKDKGLDTIELLYGVSIAYGITNDATLLSVARKQGSVVLTGDGLALARDIASNLDQPFDYRSMQFRDGAQGDRGSLAILRSDKKPGHQALVMKNTAQGLGHGHFDKLSWLFYDNDYEIIKDYGAARFLNIEPKGGGGYLPENKTWAKQSIAHNTLVVDETSHFNADLALAETHSPKTLMFEAGVGVADDKQESHVALVSAQMLGAYEDVEFTRTLAMLNTPDLAHPIIIDVLKAVGEQNHQYDLPLHYQGHITNINFPVDSHVSHLKALGKKNGYQHLWLKARGAVKSDRDIAQVTWLQDNRFYTLSARATDEQTFLFTELGANDPDFNLRRESAIIQRVEKARDHTFVSVLEPHGEYNGALEFTRDPYSQIAKVSLIQEGPVDFIRIESVHGKVWGLGLAYQAGKATKNVVRYQGRDLHWRGFYHLFDLSK